MNDNKVFREAFLKTSRARKLISEIEQAVKEYLDSNPVSAHFSRELCPARLDLCVRSMEAVGPIVGDVIHNLRSSLDLMASQLARSNGQSDKDVYFPFGRNFDSFKVSINSRKFWRTGAASVKLVETMRPYTGGDDVLRALHDLDIQDKHCSLIAISDNKGLEIRDPEHEDLFSPQGVVASFTNFKLVFSQGNFFSDHEVIPTLLLLLEKVESILSQFESVVQTN